MNQPWPPEPTVDLAAGYAALVDGRGAVATGREVVRIVGADAVSFVQGQVSQDVAALSPGQSAATFVLAPQGKVDAWGRVTVVADDEVLLDVDRGRGQAVADRLGRFLLRVKATVELIDWHVLSLPGAAEAPLVDEGVAVASSCLGWDGWDVLGPAPEVPVGRLVVPVSAWEAVRIEAGVPVSGVDIDESTIPAESGLVEGSASFTKGCYVGQELVARIDSRGHVNRHLRRIVIDDPGVAAGATLHAPGHDRSVGTLTSVAWSPGRAASVALALVRREIEPGAQIEVRWGPSNAVGIVESARGEGP